MRAVSTETLQRPATSCFPTTTAGIPESYSAQTFKIPSHWLSTTLILQNPGQRRMDFIIAFRTDLYIKVYQRILSADYTVLSILPSANPLNERDGFSVIGGNGHMYEMFGDCGLRHCLPLRKLMRGRNIHAIT